MRRGTLGDRRGCDGRVVDVRRGGDRAIIVIGLGGDRTVLTIRRGGRRGVIDVRRGGRGRLGRSPATNHRTYERNYPRPATKQAAAQTQPVDEFASVDKLLCVSQRVAEYP
jgi:hypothetical protein